MTYSSTVIIQYAKHTHMRTHEIHAGVPLINYAKVVLAVLRVLRRRLMTIPRFPSEYMATLFGQERLSVYCACLEC